MLTWLFIHGLNVIVKSNVIVRAVVVLIGIIVIIIIIVIANHYNVLWACNLAIVPIVSVVPIFFAYFILLEFTDFIQNFII